MDSIVSTGAAALMAVRVLLDHDVPEENISLGKSVFKQNMLIKTRKTNMVHSIK
jgi:hypothetical protein